MAPESRWRDRLILGTYIAVLATALSAFVAVSPRLVAQVAEFVRIAGLVSTVPGTSYTPLGSVHVLNFDPPSTLKSVAGQVDLKAGVLVSVAGQVDLKAGVLVSTAGQVDLKAGAAVSVYPGATYTPQLGGINSFAIGASTTFPVATPFQGPSGSLLVSTAGLSWSGPTVTSQLTERFVGTGQWLGSAQLVAGTSGLRVCVKEFDIGLSSLASSVGFYSAANGGSASLSTPLWSSSYAGTGGINKPASGGSSEPIDKFCTLAGDSLWWGTLSSNSNVTWVNMLWSHRRF